MLRITAEANICGWLQPGRDTTVFRLSLVKRQPDDSLAVQCERDTFDAKQPGCIVVMHKQVLPDAVCKHLVGSHLHWCLLRLLGREQWLSRLGRQLQQHLQKHIKPGQACIELLCLCSTVLCCHRTHVPQHSVTTFCMPDTAVLFLISKAQGQV